MSAGPRLPLDVARGLARALFDRWGLMGAEDDPQASCVAVGSVRRRRPEVGDLEIIAPLPEAPNPDATDDPIFRRINATMTNPWREPPGLFALPEAPPASPLGYVVKGLAPGFLAASLVIRIKTGGELPVQVNRYTRDNRGWTMLRTTGPRDFGVWFLGRWKRAFGIPGGEGGQPASVDGHLVDAAGKLVSVPTEAECFRLIGQAPILPERRDEWVERMATREAYR